MIIVYGLALLSASVLLVGFVAKKRNSPAAPKWAASKALTSTVLFTTITGIIFGVALLFQAAFDLANVNFGLIEAVLVAVTLAVTYMAARMIWGKASGAAPAVKGTSTVAGPDGKV